MSDTERRARAHFDAGAWEEDLARTTLGGRQAAEAARKDYEQHGVPITQLRRVAEHGHDRTILPDCMKVYLPTPDGRFGVIFMLKFEPDGRPVLMFLAFGVRPPPRLTAPNRLPNRPSAPTRAATKALSLFFVPYRPPKNDLSKVEGPIEKSGRLMLLDPVAGDSRGRGRFRGRSDRAGRVP